MKRKVVLTLLFVVVLAGLTLTAALSAQEGSLLCPDFGRLDYNYACRNGGWWPPQPAAGCPDYGRLDYNYACQNGWRPRPTSTGNAWQSRRRWGYW